MPKSLPKILTIFFLAVFIFQLACLIFLFALPIAGQASNIEFSPQAQGLDYTFNSSDKTTGNIANYIRAIYKYAIGIVGILAAVVLMIGGVMWVVAGGSATMIGEAKSWIGAALTGLVLALMSYLILATVNPALVNFKTTGIKTVEESKEESKIKSELAECCQNDSDCTLGYICNKNILSGDCYGKEGYGACQIASGLSENSLCTNSNQCQSPLKCIAPTGTSSYRCVTVGGDCGDGGICLEDCASNGKSWCSTCSGSCPGGLWCCK